MDPYLWLAAFTTAGGLYVLLLFAHRRIPRHPSPDSVNQLRADFETLVDAFQDLAEKHDQTIGRSHAKIGSLRKKLRRLQEEEGELDEDDDEAPQDGYPPQVVAPAPPTREQMKAAARARLRERAS